MSVDALAVVLVETEVERRERRDRSGDADGARRVERGQDARGRAAPQASSSSPVGGSECRKRSVSRTEPTSRLVRELERDELGRAAADVEHERSGLDLADASQHQLRLFVAAQQLRCEPVRPLDLAEERLAVLGVANGARRDEQRPLGAEPLRLAPVVGQDVANAGDGEGEEAVALVDPFAEPGDLGATDDLAQPAVVDVGDEQARRVRALVDRCDSHYFLG